MPGAVAALAATSPKLPSYVFKARGILARARAVEYADIARDYGDELLLAALRENDVGFARTVVEKLDLGRERSLSEVLVDALRFHGAGALDVLEMLVTSGRPAFGVRACSSSGEQLLSWACLFGCLGAVKLLVALGAPLNHQYALSSGRRFCPALDALLGGHEECLREVLMRGANPHFVYDTSDKPAITMLDVATRRDEPASVSLILRAMEKRGPYTPVDLGNALLEAARSCRSVVVPGILIHAGASFRFQTVEKEPTPFFYAAMDGKDRVARYLLRRHGSEVVRSQPDYCLWWNYSSSLHGIEPSASAYDYLRLLLRLGFPLTQERYEFAWTVGLFYDSKDISRLLLRRIPSTGSSTPDSGLLAEALSLAVTDGRKRCFQALIDHGALRGEVVSKRALSLAAAMCKDDRQLYETLIAAGAKLNPRADRVWGIVADYMECVAREKDVSAKSRQPLGFDLFKEIMRSGNVDEMRCDRIGNKALHLAAFGNHLAHADFLLEEMNANVNVRNDAGESPLFTATRQGYFGIVSRLVEVSDLDLTPSLTRNSKKFCVGGGSFFLRSGTDAFLVAAIFMRWDILELLVEKGANVHSVDDRGRNAIWLALYHYDLVFHRDLPETDFVYPLLNFGVSVECADAVTGIRSIHVAAKRGMVDSIRWLCLNGADVNARDVDGNTTLHWTVRGLRFSEHFVLELVRELGADVNAQNLEGETALHIVARLGTVAEAEALLEAGASVNAADARGRTPLMIACECGGRGELRKRWDGTNTEWRKERRSPLSLVHALLRAGSDVSRASSRGLQALHFAAASGQTDVCRFLAFHARGVKLNARSASGLTPLHLACRSGHAAAAELLLAAGARPNERDGRGRAPLHTAAAKGHAGCASVLLGRGADASLRCAAQLLPLDLSRRNGHARVAAALAQQAGVEVRNDGKTGVSDVGCSSSLPAGVVESGFVGGDAFLAGLSF